MNLAGQNLYRVYYRVEYVKDQEFQKLVVAFSEGEARSYVDDIVKVQLVESDISMIIPDQYVNNRKGFVNYVNNTL